MSDVVPDRTTELPELTGDFENRVEQVVKWFFQNFEDPAERTPFESAEGGYIYIWGEADAREEISNKFGAYITDATQAVIDEAVEQIEKDGLIWVPVPHPSDYE